MARRDKTAWLLLLGALLLLRRRGGGGGAVPGSARNMPVDFSSEMSPVARVASNVRNPLDGSLREPWGLAVHTTGSGVLARAKAKGRKPIDVALDDYRAMSRTPSAHGGKPVWLGPSYVIDYDGTIYQLAPDNIITGHAGPIGGKFPDAPRRYRDGSWADTVSPMTLTMWKAKWPIFRHPYDLFPSSSPNVDYVGVEMVPVGAGYGGAPMAKGLTFTKAQHDAIVRLGRDLASRHAWPASWAVTNRLVGHEDVDPLNRSDANGGWDPGYLRRLPYFDFAYVRKALAS